MAKCSKWPRCNHYVQLFCPYCGHPALTQPLICCKEYGHEEAHCVDPATGEIVEEKLPWQSSTRMDRVWDRIDRVWDSGCIIGITVAMLYLLGVV